MHVLSRSYHLQSQDALGRYHHTLEAWCAPFAMTLVRTVTVRCSLMFAARKLLSDSLGLSRNELFGHRVCDPVDIVREGYSGSGRSKTKPLLDFVTNTLSQVHKVLELARGNLTLAQTKMKTH